MAKRLSSEQKKTILKLFIDGKTIDELAIEFNFAKLTIARNLKQMLGESKYKKLIDSQKNIKKSKVSELKRKFPYSNDFQNEKKDKADSTNQKLENSEIESKFSKSSEFMEIYPIEVDFENSPQKDLSSVSISDVQFPKIVYMIVDKKIELEIKTLKDYPEWQFLSEVETNRKSIEIFNDLKNAKIACNKNQKVIKVPNPDVFKLVAPILTSRGISRIVNADKLIAL